MFNKKYLPVLLGLVILSAMIFGACAPAPAPEAPVAAPTMSSAEDVAAEAAIKAAVPTELSNCTVGMVLIDSSYSVEKYQSECVIAEGETWKITLLAGSLGGAPGSQITLFDKRDNFIAFTASSGTSFEDYSLYDEGLLGKVEIRMPQTRLLDHYVIEEITITDYEPADMECVTQAETLYYIQGNYDLTYPFGPSLEIKRGPNEQYSFISPMTDGENMWLAAHYEGNEISLDEMVPFPSYGEITTLEGTYINEETGENISTNIPIESCGGGFYTADLFVQ